MIKYNEIVNQLNDDLQKLIDHGVGKSQEASGSISLVSEAILFLRKAMVKKTFKSKKDEIIFFKEIKAPIIAKFIYFKQLQEIETHRLIAIDEDITGFIKEKLSFFKHVFQDNLEFITYIENDSTDLDLVYFIRRQKITPIFISNSSDLFDPEFETSHDKLLSNYLAFKMLKEFLGIEEKSFKPKLCWTGIQSEIVELIYALHTSKKLNHGKASLKLIVSQFQHTMQFNIGDFYRVYNELKDRKKISRTSFLESLVDDLNTRMYNDLEK